MPVKEITVALSTPFIPTVPTSDVHLSGARHRINETGQIARELDARAADEAVWLALHLVQRAGWGDLVEALALVKAQTVARRRAVEQG